MSANDQKMATSLVHGIGSMKMIGSMVGLSAFALYAIYSQYTKYSNTALPKASRDIAWWYMIALAIAWMVGIYVIYKLMGSPTATAIAAVA